MCSRKDKISPATMGLILVCTVVYCFDKYFISSEEALLTISLGDMILDGSTIWGKILGFCGGTLFTTLAYNTDLFLSGEIWRPITCLFVHLFIVHLAVNMLALWIVGSKVEKLIGSKRFLLLYFTSGIVDLFLTNLLFLKDSAALLNGGASGSIFAITGYSFMYQVLHRRETGKTYKKGELAYLIFYGVFFSYIVGDSWTACAHTIAFLLGIIICLFVSLLKKKCRPLSPEVK